jgi:hypothetical protein
MKKRLLPLVALLASFAFTNVDAQNARVNIIHNCADPLATEVDVYVNGVNEVNDFGFRTATGFIDLPAGVPLDIAVAPGNSTSVADAIYNTQLTLVDGETYVVVATGVVGTGFNPSQPFNLEVYAGARETAAQSGNTDLLVYHGATDAPTVDVKAVGAGTVVDDLAYATFNTSYLELPTNDYIVQIFDQSGTTAVAQYFAPLQTLTLNGAALTVVASGFLDPSVNNNGPVFGLWAAPATAGPLVELPSIFTFTSRVQIIHNCADAAASEVDVYLNDILAIPSFAFRTATPYLDLPAGVPNSIAIAPAGSSSVADAIVTFPANFVANETYAVIASGIVDPTNYNPAPAFNLEIYAGAREVSNIQTNTDILVFHGSTDAPTVDIDEMNAGNLIDDISYGEFAVNGYLELTTNNYVIQVKDASGTVVVAEFEAPLFDLSLQGVSLTVVASGFLDTAANNAGPVFGLYAALPNGGALYELPVYLPPSNDARIQIIHNCAELAAASVDIYVDGVLEFNDVAFRTATQFFSLPGGVQFDVAIAPGSSTSVADAVATFPVTFDDGETYIIVASGIVSQSGYSPATPFTLEVYNQGRELATIGSNTDVLVFHGATDAPMVDVLAGGNVIVDDISYGEFNAAGYLELPTADYQLEIQVAATGASVVTYEAPLASLNLDGQAITVLASGFLDPAQNSNGPAFGLWATLSSGGALVELPVFVSVKDLNSNVNMTFFPNPANENIYLNLSGTDNIQALIRISSITGQIVLERNINMTNGTQIVSQDVSQLSAGLYTVELISDSKRIVNKLSITK